LANPFILVSSLVFGAIVLPRIDSRLSLRRLFRRAPKESALNAVAEPLVQSDTGWTLIRCEDADAFSAWLGRDEEGLPTRPGEEPSLGSHVLIEMFGCEGSMLEAERYVGQAMRDAAIESKATVVEQSFHEFKPWGVSGAVIIQESHYTIHTWPEHRYAAIDLFYCGGNILVHKAVDVLRDRFQPERIKFLVVRRGLQHEVDK
jgi:S-adenosylmethionine decarboxylase